MTHGRQNAVSGYQVNLNGAGATADVVSRSVARDDSSQTFNARITGIVIADDTIKTPQGVTIGMDIDEALKLMDEIEEEELTVEENRGVYSFQYGPVLLMIKADSNGEITAIQYTAVNEED